MKYHSDPLPNSSHTVHFLAPLQQCVSPSLLQELSASWDVVLLGQKSYTHLTQIEILSLSPQVSLSQHLPNLLSFRTNCLHKKERRKWGLYSCAFFPVVGSTWHHSSQALDCPPPLQAKASRVCQDSLSILDPATLEQLPRFGRFHRFHIEWLYVSEVQLS